MKHTRASTCSIGELRKELKRPVSIDEALRRLLNLKRNKPSRFAGGWEMDEKETEKLKNELKAAWKKMKLFQPQT